MKTLLAFLALLTLGHAAGTVQQSGPNQSGNSNVWVFTFNWTGDASTGSVPSTLATGATCCQGYSITGVEVIPGTPAPTDGYGVALNDFSGADLLGGAAAAASTNTPQNFAPVTSIPLFGSFTLAISRQTTASAKGTVIVFMAPTTRAMLVAPNGSVPVYRGGSFSQQKGGLVTLYPPSLNAACAGVNSSCVGLPVASNGAPISCAGTTTSCLQESLNYAAAHGMDFYIVGGDEIYTSRGGNCSSGSPAGPGPTCNQILFWITTTWRWPSIQGLHIGSGSIAVIGTPAGGTPCISVDSLEMAQVELPIQVICGSTGPALTFHPSSPAPLDNGVGDVPVRFHLGSIASTATNAAITFDNSTGGTTTSTFSFDEVLSTGLFGIQVFSTGVYEFAGVHVFAPFIHGYSSTGLVVGSGNVSGGSNCLGGISGNTWLVNFTPGVNTGRGVDSSACGDTYNIGLLSSQTGGSLAIVNNVTASQNTYNLGWVQSQNPSFADLSYSLNSRVNYQPPSFASAALAVGASPFNSPTAADVAAGVLMRRRTETVSGGTVSAISVGATVASGAVSAVSGNPMQVTTTINVPTNAWILVQNVAGCTAANGYWKATNISPTVFSLQGSGACNFAYTSGGGVSQIGYQTTGSTAGMFQLQPGQFLQTTYSVLPTMARLN